MRLGALLLASLGLLAVAAAPAAAGSALSDAEAEELFLSVFQEPVAARRAGRGLAWVSHRSLLGYHGGYYGGYYGGHDPSPSPSPVPSTDPEPSPSNGPSPSPSTSPEPSPSTDPEPSPSNGPSPSPSPVNQQDTEVPLCKGVAYDGYLNSCTVWADANGDGIKGSTEPTATITSGQFVFPSGNAPGTLGVLRIETADETAKDVAQGSTVCHDATSLLAMHFPYAAPRPASCSAKFVVTPLTTLLTHASGLTPAALLEALNLPTSFDLLATDSLAAATVGNADAKRVYRREAQLQQVVLVGAKLLTKSTAYLAAGRRAMLQSLVAQVAPAAAGRRLLADAIVQALDLSSGTLVQQLIQQANLLAAATIPTADLTNMDASILAAAANGIAAMNSIIETSTSVTDIQKASVVTQTVLADNIAKLVAGEISLTQFQAATSEQTLKDAVKQASLPGDTTAPAAMKSNKGVALGVGLGIGLGVPTVATAFYFLYWKPAQAAKSGLAAPML